MILTPQPEYELLDSGDEMKLERYGRCVVARPDPQAIWKKGKSDTLWDEADATFIKGRGDEDKGRWHIRPQAEHVFSDVGNGMLGQKITLGPVTLYARLTPFKHTAIFPEQLSNWQYIQEVIHAHVGTTSMSQDAGVAHTSRPAPKVLNLFGYTGGASIAAACAGADVTHVDASKSAITWAKENMQASGLGDQAIRWMLEDAVVFVKKEIRRGNRYDGIIMDPPVFGRGAKGEVWKIERDLVPLLDMCYQLLSDEPLFFILNGYASGYSSIAYANNLMTLVERFGGQVDHGELLIQESLGGEAHANGGVSPARVHTPTSHETKRYLPCGIVARWMK